MSTLKESIFQNRLVYARKIRDLNQEEVATRANLPPTAISHFERGTRKPSFENLRKLADVLEVSVDFLMGRTDNFNETHAQEAEIFRDFDNLTDEDRKLAREFMASLAKRRVIKIFK